MTNDTKFDGQDNHRSTKRPYRSPQLTDFGPLQQVPRSNIMFGNMDTLNIFGMQFMSGSA